MPRKFYIRAGPNGLIERKSHYKKRKEYEKKKKEILKKLYEQSLSYNNQEFFHGMIKTKRINNKIIKEKQKSPKTILLDKFKFKHNQIRKKLLEDEIKQTLLLISQEQNVKYDGIKTYKKLKLNQQEIDRIKKYKKICKKCKIIF